MAVDISTYLDAIAGDKEGEEVIIAIHDAALLLGTDMYKTASIDALLENIRTKVFGKDIRMDIYEILKRLSEADPGSSGLGFVAGEFMSVYFGTIKNNTQESILYGEFTEEE